jgi:hypothetical protein
MKISQSMMKSYVDYLNGKECGLLFKGKYIDKCVETIPSSAMKEGIYFEYLCTGGLPRNGQVPEPEKTAKGTLTAPYQRVVEASHLFKKIFEHYDIKIEKVGYSLDSDNMTGIMDIFGEMNGKKCIIDLKYSGLIDDKWNDIGWDTESLPMKDSLMIQGVHYKILVKEVLGLDVDFYYFIFNSKDPSDMKIIKQTTDPDKYALHKQQVARMQRSIENEIEKGFKATPDYRVCKDCPMFANCSERAEYPSVQEVFY